MHKTLALLILVLPLTTQAGTLFVGLEGSSPPTRSSDLAGFPDVSWDTHYSFDVSGAAATEDGDLFLCNGAFTTKLYHATLDQTPIYLCTISNDMSALAYGRETLYGYSNYATPKGIYSIDTATGQATLVLDVYSGTGFRFFGLGYNPHDDLFYGYTEYGDNGLYSINIDTGEMIKLAGSIPASNGQGRGLAVGNNTVYLTATRGDDGVSYFAYDLNQGAGGDWLAFTNAYPSYHSTGGAAWIASDTATGDAGPATARMLLGAYPNPFNPRTNIRVDMQARGIVSLEVYSLSGQRVALLHHGILPEGRHELVWNGRNDAGLESSSGIYLLLLRMGERGETRKLLLLR